MNTLNLEQEKLRPFWVYAKGYLNICSERSIRYS